MAGDKKITELTTAGPLVGNEIFPIVQAGQNKRITLNGIRDYIGSGGGGGDLSAIIWNEIPTGAIDNSNFIYSMANPFIAQSLCVYYNGMRLVSGPGRDYIVISSTQIQLNFIPQMSDILLCDYIKA